MESFELDVQTKYKPLLKKKTYLCNLTLNLMVGELSLLWQPHVTTSLRNTFCFVHIVMSAVYSHNVLCMQTEFVLYCIVSWAYCHVRTVYIILCFIIVTKCHFAHLQFTYENTAEEQFCHVQYVQYFSTSCSSDKKFVVYVKGFVYERVFL